MYHSGKNNLYGSKTEFSRFANKLAIGYTNSAPDSTTDVEICNFIVDWHKTNLKKSDEDLQYEDNGELSYKYSQFWSVFMDKG